MTNIEKLSLIMLTCTILGVKKYTYRQKGECMSLEFVSVASGSSGNSYIIKKGKDAFILDCGVSGKRIIETLEMAGLSGQNVKGIFLTHEHTDHIKSIRKIAKFAEQAPIYCSEGTFDKVEDKVERNRWVRVKPKEQLEVEGIGVSVFALSHDAQEGTGFVFSSHGRKAMVITDTGQITAEMEAHLRDVDLLALEANYEESMLLMGNYPYQLKRRIMGKFGHLSNEDCAEAIFALNMARKEKERPVKVLLSHISKENNSPDHALLTVKNLLQSRGLYEDWNFKLGVLRRDQPSPLFKV